MHLFKNFLVASFLFAGVFSGPVHSQVAVTAAFPGGNVLVEKSEGNTVFVGPDLRGGGAWFYWNFEARSATPARGTFVFASTRHMGVRGPAYSTDGGVKWKWLGADKVSEIPPADATKKAPPQVAFSWDFTRPNESVRFSVGVPYVQSHFDSFMAGYKGNPLLTRSTLTKTLKGREVEFLQIGQPGPGKRAVLLTARHHACEAMASYVLEGFLKEALSDSAAAKKFRAEYVLYTVPFADKDGVEDGDQGKNRAPHDHNRDYGAAPIYPEIKAIQDMADKKEISLSMDLHCPALKGDVHEAFHFLGLGVPHVKDNLTEWTKWFGEEKPQDMGTPLIYLADPAKPKAVDRRINSHYFATRDGSLLSATLEIPYSQLNVELNAERAREYGTAMLKAWNHTVFLPAAGAPERGAAGHEQFKAWSAAMLAPHRSKPQESEAVANKILEDKNANPVYAAEANNAMALIKTWQKKPEEVLPYTSATLANVGATTSQYLFAHSYRMRALANDPKTTVEMFEANLAQARTNPVPHPPNLTSYLASAVSFYERTGDFRTAIKYSRELVPVAPYFEKGKYLLKMASLHESLKEPAKAAEVRKETVSLLKDLIGPVPKRNIFSAMMTVDHFDAVMGIPTSTLEEKRAAAALVLNHEVTAKMYKDRIRNEMEKADPGGTAAAATPAA